MRPRAPDVGRYVQALQHLPSPCIGIIAMTHYAQGAQWGGHLCQYRAARVERGGGVLGHILHRPAKGSQAPGTAPAHNLTVQQHLAPILRARGVEQQQSPQQRRLPTPRAPDQRHVLPRHQAEVHATHHHVMLTVEPRVGARQTTCLKPAHAAAPEAASAPSMVSSAAASHMATVTGCSGWARTWAAGPRSMTAPPWRTTTFPQIAAAGRS